MSIEKNPWADAFGVCFAVAIIDQAIKLAIISKTINHPFHRNYNALFGFPFQNELALIFISIMLFFAVFRRKKILRDSDIYTKLSIGLIGGGIAGNMLDRALHGFIIDYMNLQGLFSFNASDVAISLGTLLLFLKLIKK